MVNKTQTVTLSAVLSFVVIYCHPVNFTFVELSMLYEVHQCQLKANSYRLAESLRQIWTAGTGQKRIWYHQAGGGGGSEEPGLQPDG